MPPHGTTRRAETGAYLRIGDFARLAGISPSLLRDWGRLGILQPQRTASGYRMFTEHDLRIAKRAVYLRKVTRLNAPAILATLKREGLVRARPNGSIDGRPLGHRLRHLREESGRSLSEVARNVGVSAGFLSALERSQGAASVGTLRKLAQFYGVNILSFFGDADGTGPIVHPGDRKVLSAGPGVRMELLARGDTAMEPHLFRVAPGRSSGDSYHHEGEEFLYVLRGELEISLDGQSHRLHSGDSMYFDSSTPHRWRNPGKKVAEVLWINTPPSF